MKKLILLTIILLFIVGGGVALAAHKDTVKEPPLTQNSTQYTPPAKPAPDNCPTDNSDAAGFGPDPYNMPSYGAAQDYSCMEAQQVDQLE